MLNLSVCPLCLGNKLKPLLSCKDYTVSNQTFQLEKCEGCGFVLTNPQPEEKDLPKYYQSDAYISHSNKSLNAIDQVYKLCRNFTLKWKFNLIQKHSEIKTTSILDYGCGTGAFLQKCKKHQLEIAGVEPSSTARVIASDNTATSIFSNLTQVKTSFDAITLWHVLEHIPDLHETLESLKTRLNENGTMFIAVPNHESSDAKQYGVHWAGYDVPRHLWHFSRTTMERFLTSHQLNLVHVVPMRLDAYYVSLLSAKYKSPKTGVSNMINAVIQGWKSNHAARQTGEFSSLIYIVRK